MRKVGFVPTIVLATTGSLLYSFSVVSWTTGFLMLLPFILVALLKGRAALADGTWGGPP